MRSAVQNCQSRTVIELANQAWLEESFQISDSARLQVLSEIFPGGPTRLGTRQSLDLDRLNDLSRPLGVLATWEPEGLRVFRIHL